MQIQGTFIIRGSSVAQHGPEEYGVQIKSMTLEQGLVEYIEGKGIHLSLSFLICKMGSDITYTQSS